MGQINISGTSADVQLKSNNSITASQAFTFPDTGGELVVTPGTADIETSGSISAGGRSITLRADGSQTNTNSYGVARTGGNATDVSFVSTWNGTTTSYITAEGSYVGAAGKVVLAPDQSNYKLAGMGSGTGQTIKYNTSTGEIGFDSSSARYKNNIRDNDDVGLEKVMQLRPVKFEYKQDGRTDIGFIAEEMAEVIPELVFNDQEGKPEGVAYDRISAVLTKALQESLTRIEALEAQLTALQEAQS